MVIGEIRDQWVRYMKIADTLFDSPEGCDDPKYKKVVKIVDNLVKVYMDRLVHEGCIESYVMDDTDPILYVRRSGKLYEIDDEGEIRRVNESV